MKKLIIILAILFSYNAYSQTHLPAVDNKVVYEGTISFPASCPYIVISGSWADTVGSGSNVKAEDSAQVALAASVFADWITAGEIDTVGYTIRSTDTCRMYYHILPHNATEDSAYYFRYANTSGTIAWRQFTTDPLPLLSEKLLFVGELISSTTANPKIGLMSKYWWIAPTTNADDGTDFIDMNTALEHNLSLAPAALDTVLTAPIWLYGRIYGTFMHWGSEAKTIKYKLWMARIDRRW